MIWICEPPRFGLSTLNINTQRLVSRRSLRHDPIFDALIAKLYPSREVYEKEQDELLNQVIRKGCVRVDTEESKFTEFQCDAIVELGFL